jgi:hypothetical protein
MLLVVDAAAVIPNIIMNNSGSRVLALILPSLKVVFKKLLSDVKLLPYRHDFLFTYLRV